MEIRSIEEPLEFAAILDDLVGGSPGRHNLILGLTHTLIERPEVYPDYHLWVVDGREGPRAAALRTPPYNAVITDAEDRAVAAAVADVFDADTPGVVGNRPTVDWAVEEWGARGGSSALSMAQGVFELRTVSEVPVPDGAPRPAVEADRDLLVSWLSEFSAEAIPDEWDGTGERAQRAVDHRLSAPDRTSGFWIWEVDGDPRALSGHGDRSPYGIRVGPVYTPTHRRRRGYATALVAHQSARLLETGVPACHLFTDLGNPTSNAVYERIGYRRIAESAMYRFGHREASR